MLPFYLQYDFKQRENHIIIYRTANILTRTLYFYRLTNV